MPNLPAPSGSPATDFAVVLLAELEEAGVRHVVLSPGSRSQALALAAAEFERAGRIRLHVRLDERSAGFLALGLAIETGAPTAVATTSGTAVANLHPAVLEAHHSAVPLILLTADRPPELRGIGSNQTTHQPRLFGEALRLIRDVEAPTDSGVDGDFIRELARESVSAALGRSSAPGLLAAAGPVQLNIAFREPLSAPVTTLPPLRGAGPAGTAPNPAALRAPMLPGYPVTSPVHGAAGAGSAVQGAAGAGSAVQGAAGAGSAGGVAGAGSASGAAAELREGWLGRNVARSPMSESTVVGRTAELVVDAEPATLVVAGHAAGPAAEAAARALGAPLVAEVSSGSRFGPNLVPAYRTVLGEPEFGGAVRRVVVFGHPTLTREIPALLKRDDVEVIVVRGAMPEAYDPSHAAIVVEAVRVLSTTSTLEGPAPAADDRAHRAWVGRWVHAGRALVTDDDAAPDLEAGHVEFLRAEVDVIRQAVTRRHLVDALWRLTWPHDRLVLGASRLIREADVAVPGKKIAVHANRGLAGIDGTIATASGIALASQAGGTSGSPQLDWADGARGLTRVLVGDLTLLHDAGSLLFGDGEARPRLQIVVGNDHGGTIFDGLEVARTAPDDAMTRVQLTPQPVSFEHLARAYGWEHVRAATRGELEQALAGPAGVLIEVPLAR